MHGLFGLALKSPRSILTSRRQHPPPSTQKRCFFRRWIIFQEKEKKNLLFWQAPPPPSLKAFVAKRGVSRKTSSPPFPYFSFGAAGESLDSSFPPPPPLQPSSSPFNGFYDHLMERGLPEGFLLSFATLLNIRDISIKASLSIQS